MRLRMNWICIVALVVVGLGLLLTLTPFFKNPIGHPPSYYTEGRVRTLLEVVAARGLLDDPPLAFPHGDIRSLYQWFASPHVGIMLEDLPRDLIRPEEGVFVDNWDRPLVYRFPTARGGSMFELYSMGPNGVDDGGSGDDVPCWPLAEFAAYRNHFAKGVVNEHWIRANLGRLQRDAEGKIIGAPPEELDAIEEHRLRKAGTSP